MREKNQRGMDGDTDDEIDGEADGGIVDITLSQQKIVSLTICRGQTVGNAGFISSYLV